MTLMTANKCLLLKKCDESVDGCVSQGLLSNWAQEIEEAQELIRVGYITSCSYGHNGVYAITEEGRRAFRELSK